jgi:hypothetical protein
MELLLSLGNKLGRPAGETLEITIGRVVRFRWATSHWEALTVQHLELHSIDDSALHLV